EQEKRFCPGLDVIAAPALRFQEVWKERKFTPDPNYFTVLVAMPLHQMERQETLQVVTEFVQHYQLSNLRMWIKYHPATAAKHMKGVTEVSWPPYVKLVNGDFRDCLEQSDLLVSNASSVCMEALAKGVPVVVVGSRR